NRVCHRGQSLRSLYLSRGDLGSGVGMDQPPFHCGTRGQMVAVLPRQFPFGGEDPFAQRQDDRTPPPGGRQYCADRCPGGRMTYQVGPVDKKICPIAGIFFCLSFLNFKKASVLLKIRLFEDWLPWL